jgi:hypothetical protein
MIELKAYHAATDTYVSMDIGTTQTIQFVSDSGLLDFDRIPGSYTLPISIPKSINNNKVFQYAYKNNAQIDATIFRIPCQLFLNQHLLITGTLRIADCTNSYNCSIAVDMGAFADENKDKKLYEFYGDDPAQSQPFTFPTEALEGPDVYDYCLPLVGNNLFYEGHPYEADALPAQNAYDVIEEDYTVNFRNDVFNAVTPFLYLFKVINQIFANYNLTENCFDTEELKRLCIYNNVNAANIFRNGFTEEYFVTITTYVPANHLPEITINEFLISMKNYFCCLLIQQRGETKMVFLKDILINPNYTDITDKVLDAGKKIVFDKKPNIWILPNNDSGDENLSQITPLNSFMQSTRDRIFPAAPSIISGNTYKFNEIVIQDKDIDDNPLLIKYVRILHYYNGSETIYPAGLDSISDPIVDYRYTFANGYYSQNPPDVTFSSSISQSYWEPQDEHPYSLTINQKGNDTRWFTGIPATEPPTFNAFNLRFLFDKGWVEDTNGIITWTYPHASLDSDNLSLCFHHEKGLVKNFWEDYLNVLANHDYILEKQIALSIAEIINFDHTKKYRFDGKDYLIPKFKLNINANGTISPALCTMYPC